MIFQKKDGNSEQRVFRTFLRGTIGKHLKRKMTLRIDPPMKDAIQTHTKIWWYDRR